MASRRLDRRWGALLVAGALTAACGSTVDHQEIVAAWEARSPGGPSSEGAAGSPTGAADPGGSPTGLPIAGDSAEPGAEGAAGGAAADPGTGTPAAGGAGDATAGEGAPPSGGDPIRIGSVGTLSGPAGAGFGPAMRALPVWVQWVNARGGINGHQVDLYQVDDGGDPSRNLAITRDLVENRGVIAFVNNYAATSGQGSAQYLTEHGIPVIQGDTSLPHWFSSPMFFPVSGNLESPVLFNALAPLTDGRRLATLVCAEAPNCGRIARLTGEYAPQAGWEVVYQGQASLAQPDFTSECLNMQRAQADLVIALFDSNSVKRVARSCSRQGFNPRYLLVIGVSDGSFAALPEFGGSGGPMSTFPFLGVSGPPGVDEFHQAFERYAPSVELAPAHSAGWVGAKLLERVAQGVSEHPTTEEILAGLHSLQQETLGGLVAPLTYPEGATDNSAQIPDCFFFMQILDGQWQAPSGMEMRCY